MSERKTDTVDTILWSLETAVDRTLPGSVPEFAASDAAAGEVFETLADAAPSAAPPEGFFDRIEAEIDTPPVMGIETIAANTGEWLDRGNGVWRKPMAEAPDGRKIYLLRCEPGGVIRAHIHEGWEYALVLEGRFEMAGRTFRAGDAHYSAANSVHPEITTDTNCLLLVVA
jgi:anti-sigma factor ChrR (cupin superfamily)